MADDVLEPKTTMVLLARLIKRATVCKTCRLLAATQRANSTNLFSQSRNNKLYKRYCVQSVSLVITVHLALFLKQQFICSRCDETYPLFRRPTFSRLTCNYIRNLRKGLRGSEGCYKKKKSELNFPSSLHNSSGCHFACVNHYVKSNLCLEFNWIAFTKLSWTDVYPPRKRDVDIACVIISCL